MGADPEGGEELGAGGLTVETVSSHEDLVRLLAEQFALADVSLRELESRADKAGGTRLPRATCADMLAGRRFPKRAVMMAFLRACRVPESRLPAWERAWERVAVSRMPPGTEPPAGPPRPGAGGSGAAGLRAVWAGASGDPGRVRRRALVMAAAVAVAMLATAVTLGVVIGRQDRHHDRSALGQEDRRHDRLEGPLHRTVGADRIVTDDGRAFDRGGSSRFTVTVDPANTGVRLIRRLDVGVALQQAAITVNGAPAGKWRPLLGDSEFKWRNQVVELPPHLTAGRRSLTIVNTFLDSSLGFNEFRYTVEQKIGGAWSIADQVDVGPGHVADEAAHGYRIVKQGWQGTQTFAYPPLREDWTVR